MVRQVAIGLAGGQDKANVFRNFTSASKTGSAFLDSLDFSELPVHAR